jgi:hypothetical protein
MSFFKGPGTGCEKVGSCDGVFGKSYRAVEGRGSAVCGGGEIFRVICYADFGGLATAVCAGDWNGYLRFIFSGGAPMAR